MSGHVLLGGFLVILGLAAIVFRKYMRVLSGSELNWDQRPYMQGDTPSPKWLQILSVLGGLLFIGAGLLTMFGILK